MDEIKLSREGWRQSADAWIRSVEEGDLSRRYILDPVMLDWIGPLTKESVLDIGCGEGRFCRMMEGSAGSVVGVDLTQELVQAAKARGGVYVVGNGECLPFASNAFDLAVSYVVLLDIPDYRAAIREMARVLKPGGYAVVSNLNPFVSSQSGGWIRDEAGRKLHFPVDQYLEERGTQVGWAGISVYNWHRPLENYMSAFLESGLLLRRYAEPQPSLDTCEQVPEIADGRRIPWFHVMLWQKPG